MAASITWFRLPSCFAIGRSDREPSRGVLAGPQAPGSSHYRSPTQNSHLFNTHRYQLTTASYPVLQEISSPWYRYQLLTTARCVALLHSLGCGIDDQADQLCAQPSGHSLPLRRRGSGGPSSNGSHRRRPSRERARCVSAPAPAASASRREVPCRDFTARSALLRVLVRPLVAYMLHEAWTEVIFLGRGYVTRTSPSKR